MVEVKCLLCKGELVNLQGGEAFRCKKCGHYHALFSDNELKYMKEIPEKIKEMLDKMTSRL